MNRVIDIPKEVEEMRLRRLDEAKALGLGQHVRTHTFLKTVTMTLNAANCAMAYQTVPSLRARPSELDERMTAYFLSRLDSGQKLSANELLSIVRFLKNQGVRHVAK
jgi:hypothetical protein